MIPAVKLSAELIENFSKRYLAKQFDDPQPIPSFHRECWQLYTSPATEAGVAAPRGHAKTTALTTVYMLAELLFRCTEYAILVSANEEMATELLGDISRELVENEDLIRDFQIKKLLSSAKTDIIVECLDGHQFRIIARGSGQKMRGRKWRGKRPGLVVCDDLEDDEQVDSIERRQKFRRWFYRALKPSLRRGGRIRIHGTILHEDALLARLMKDKTWKTKFYRAHASFDDFTDILWPQQFNEKKLREIRQGYIEQFDSSGYSQEYLNDPFDGDESFLRKDDFLAMNDRDRDLPKRIAVGCDFAVSKAQKANRTSFTIGGQDFQNILHIIGVRVDRWTSLEWIEEMLDIQKRYDPEYFFVEDGVIWKAIEPMLQKEMRAKNIFLNTVPIMSIKDKKTNATPLKKRMKAGAVRFDKEANWYAPCEAELLKFTGNNDAVADDQVDSTAILVRGLDQLPSQDEEDFMDEDELYFRGHGPNRGGSSGNRSKVTGY